MSDNNREAGSTSSRRELLIKEQKEAAEILIDALGSVEAAAVYADVSADSLHNWRKGRTVASGLSRQKLTTAASGAPKEKFVSKRGGKRERLPDSRANLERELREFRLAPPPVRVETLRNILADSGLSVGELARELLIHENTLQNYLKESYKRLINRPTALKIVAFSKKLNASGGYLPNQERLQQALVALLGAALMQTGFNKRDYRRSIAIDRVAVITGLDARTVRRYFPPIEVKKISTSVVEAFEKAAAELGNIID